MVGGGVILTWDAPPSAFRPERRAMNISIDVLYELQGFGISHVLKDGYATVACPFHADSNPSGSVSLEHGGFKCFSCGETTDFVRYLAATLKKEPSLIQYELETRYGSTHDKIVPIEIVERAHKDIWTQEYLRKELLKRCVGDDIIRARRLGHLNGRIIIPVYNKSGYVVNLRKYRPGGEQKSKFVNHKGHGSPARLYPIDQLKYEKIALCGGEIKALAAAEVLNKVGIGAISCTAGEGNWEPKLNDQFKDKTVYIIYDVDETGRKGAKTVAGHLYNSAREIYIIHLPLDLDAYPHGDVNDFLAKGGDLSSVLESGELFVPLNKRHQLNGELTTVHLSAAIHAKFAAKRIRTECVVTAIGQQPFAIPRILAVACGKDQDTCGVCPIFLEPDGKEYEIHPEDPAILMMIETGADRQMNAIKQALDIPTKCSSCSFSTIDHYHVEDVRVSPKLEISNREVQREMIPAYIMQEDLVLNETYQITGRMHPHPSSQAATLLISGSKVSEDALTQYRNENPHELNVFKPKKWTVDSLHHKLDEIYEDLEANVTRIYQRRDMHLCVDLAYHSPLFIDFRGARHKGWVEVLILGDSAQGKTETAVSMQRHYKLGEKVDCKNASVAGLLGGLQQLGKKWFVTWGVIPTYDKRLIILEELKGMNPELFSKLTDMRSSGVAELPKIEKRRTHARTRLIALSNPRSSRTMATYNHGILAIRELIPGLEDIRRFDMAVILSASEIDQTEINRLQVKSMNVEHVYTSNLCQRLVLWAWTLNKVEFESEPHVMERSIKLTTKYHSSVPLVDDGSMRLKLARLSAALAARTYSTDDYETLIVRKCHVNYVADYLDRLYSSEVFNYYEYSRSQTEFEVLANEGDIRTIINTVTKPTLFARFALRANTFDAQDISEWTGFDRDTSSSLIAQFVRAMAVKRLGAKYVMSAPMIKLLRTMVDHDELDEMPEFMRETF